MTDFTCDTIGCDRRETSQVETTAGTEYKCKQCADAFRQGRRKGEKDYKDNQRMSRTVME